MTKGLPASGKSTWAKAYIKERTAKGEKWKRVNKDDMRAMLDDSQWSKENEKFILDIRDMVVTTALLSGYNVIVDDTNLHEKHERTLRKMVAMWNGEAEMKISPQPEKITFEIKDFTDISVEECIKRDQKRQNYVGEKVIRMMARQLKVNDTPKNPYDASLPDAVICDIDGTLALFGDANPYERDFLKDEINKPVKQLLEWKEAAEGDGYFKSKLILLSGRKDIFKNQTVKWLKENGIYYDALFMRQSDDLRKDVIIKKEIYEREILGKYNVLLVIDDRLQVCRMWHELGLPLFRVGDPDADF